MPKRLKHILIAVLVVVIGYLILFKTNLVISRMRDFPSWATRFQRVQAGKSLPSPLVHTEYVEELRDDFLRYFVDDRTKLIWGAGGTALHRARTDKIAWRNGSDLMATNLGPLVSLPSSYEPQRWHKNLSAYLSGADTDLDMNELVFVAFVASSFDSMTFVNQYGSDNVGSTTKIDIKRLRKEFRNR